MPTHNYLSSYSQSTRPCRLYLLRAGCLYVLALLSLFAGITLASPAPVRAEAAALQVNATSALLVDVITGKILWQKNSHKRWPPASTTKIMTAILILENANLNEKTIISQRAQDATTESSIWLQAGEELTISDLLNALLIKSANDAAVALAEHTSGSVESFVDMMNRRAAQLGAVNTHFMNPNGLYHPDHLTTAYDLSIMARHAMRYKIFNEVIAAKKAVIAWPGKKWDRTLVNRNRLLWTYKCADGVKTGFVRQSGRCLVSSATRDGWRIMGVVLGSSDAVKDSASLLDYGFKHFEPQYIAKKDRIFTQISVRGGERNKVSLVSDRDLLMVVPVGKSAAPRKEIKLIRARAPIKKGDKCGYIILYEGREQIGRAELLAAGNIEKSWLFKTLDALKLLALLGFITIMGVRIYAGRTFAKDTCKVRYSFPQRERGTDQSWSRYRKRP